MTDLERKIDLLLEKLKIVDERLDRQESRLRPFADLLAEAKKVTDLKNLSHSTISNNPKAFNNFLRTLTIPLEILQRLKQIQKVNI